MNEATQTVRAHMQRALVGSELVAPFLAAQADGEYLVTDLTAYTLMVHVRGTALIAFWNRSDLTDYLRDAWCSNAQWARAAHSCLPQDAQAEINFIELAVVLLASLAAAVGATAE
jgi:hypothetical protein